MIPLLPVLTRYVDSEPEFMTAGEHPAFQNAIVGVVFILALHG